MKNSQQETVKPNTFAEMITKFLFTQIALYMRYVAMGPVITLLVFIGIFFLFGLSHATSIDFLGGMFKTFYWLSFFSPEQTNFTSKDFFKIWAIGTLVLSLIDQFLSHKKITWHRSTKKSIKIFLAILTFEYFFSLLLLPFIPFGGQTTPLSMVPGFLGLYLFSCLVIFVNLHIIGGIDFMVKKWNEQKW